MDREGLEIDVVTPGDMKQANQQEAHKLSIERCVQALNHAYQCCDTNCRLRSCKIYKRVFTHMTFCKRKTESDCPICKQVVALCCYHAKYCTESKCLVPLCSRIKERIKEQAVQQQQPHAAPQLQNMQNLQQVTSGVSGVDLEGNAGTGIGVEGLDAGPLQAQQPHAEVANESDVAPTSEDPK